MLNKKKSFIDKIPNWGWLCISLATAILLWYFLSINEKTGRVFPFIDKMVIAFKTVVEREILWADIKSSMISVLLGFLFGFLSSVPVAFLMAWYRPVRYILEPWIQFIRNIPPLAYVPLVVIAVGVGRVPQVIVIWIATFLTMTITIYQGVRNVDETLIKAARVLGAKDSDLFIKVIFPATTPFILTAVRLGSSVALTTLIAAESTGAFAGLGMRIRSFNNSYEVEPMLLYIILIGIIGITIEKIIKFLEKKLTGWQETREV
ncbi:MAG: ABC transporter permease [Ruminococcaceae bacterium]|nr:ABC transporter permease [Oscillospiraceae bacterium]